MKMARKTDFSKDEQLFIHTLTSPDVVKRDEALESLKKYFNSLKSKSGTALSEFEVLKLWKALYHCYWYSDKLAYQTELCEKLSGLIDVLNDEEMKHLYCKTFFMTLMREWHNIDYHRVNKYYMFIRIFLNKIMTVWCKMKYATTAIQPYLDILYDTVLSKTPNGMRFHICDIYLSELSKTSKGKLSTSQFVSILQPFTKSLGATDDNHYLERLCEKIFINIINVYCTKEEQTDTIRFPNVKLNAIQKIIYDTATDEKIVEKNRKKIYNLHKQYAQATNEEQSTYTPDIEEDEGNSGGKKRKTKVEQPDKEEIVKDKRRKDKVEPDANTKRPRKKATDYF